MQRIEVTKTLPDSIYVAFSGGVDSVVMAHTAKSRGVDVTLAFFDHGNEFAKVEHDFVHYFANKNSYKLIIGAGNSTIVGSKEKFWRDSRYNWFKSLDGTVVTGHNLNDAVEWYLMTCLRGQGQYMEYEHANVVRPLITTSKDEILSYAEFYKLEWLTDPSNDDVNFTVRNRVRKELVPIATSIDSSLFSIVKKRCHQKAHKTLT